jgi:HD superfamily phosphohydrolase
MIRNIRTNSDARELETCMNAVAKRFGVENTLTDLICELVACAGLAHDLGHGPFSHQFDNVMASYGLTDTEKYPCIEHEYRSGEILELILKDIIAPGYIALMRSLIMADGEGFLYQIVSNEVNGIDCDKFDYLERDSVGLGVPISFDNRRLMMDVTVVEGDVCYPYQEREQLCEMFKSRAKLFNNAYAHKSTIALNTMMTDAMRTLPIDELLDSIRNSNMAVFCKYTDARIITMMAGKASGFIPGMKGLLIVTLINTQKN